MNKTNKKGFTIVELVIVIAVIAILAAVLIPTFNSVISKAQESSAMQKARAALQIVTMHEGGDVSKADYYFDVLDKDGKVEYRYLYSVKTNGATEPFKLVDKPNDGYAALADGTDGVFELTSTAAVATGATNKRLTAAELADINSGTLKIYKKAN